MVKHTRYIYHLKSDPYDLFCLMIRDPQDCSYVPEKRRINPTNKEIHGLPLHELKKDLISIPLHIVLTSVLIAGVKGPLKLMP